MTPDDAKLVEQARETAERWTKEAEAQTKAALDAIRSDGSDVDVLGSLALADLAFRIALGERSEAEYPQDDKSALCSCPPDLLVRGGFKGGCPVHG